MSASYLLAPEQEVLNPFPGLRPFEPDEDYLFFGRERQTDELLRKLRTTRFLSILGRSGSGKSSLVRSGLIPALWGGGMTVAGSRWRVVIMRPGEDPIANLAAALTVRGALYDEPIDEELTRAFFETTLRSSHLGLIECIQQARLPEGNNVLILVDQFEELFRYKRSRRIVGRDEAAAFVKLLLHARTSQLKCYVAITMRSDFIGDCMEFGKLPEVINDGIYLVPRMTRDELKSAVTGPVGVGGGTIAPRLVSRLLNDVGDDPDQLPILQHALMRTWDRWQNDHQPGEALDLRHYEAIGGLHTALSRHAEEAFDELDARQQEIAEKLFKALTDKASDPRGVRRPAPLSEICAVAGATTEEVAAVVENFRKPGRSFLMPPPGVPLLPTSIIDISHESLMRIWTRLSGWADDEARSGQLYLNVARAAQRHEEGVAALWRDPELQLALSWRENNHPTDAWASRYDTAFARTMAFLDASRDERDREVAEREERRRQKLVQARRLVLILSTASIITLALGAYAFVQKGKAQEETVRAENSRRRAVVAQKVAEREKDRAEYEKTRAVAEERRAVAEQERAETEKIRADERSVFAESQRQIADVERLKAETNEREARAQKAVAETAQQQAVTEKTAADKARETAVRSEEETRRLSRVAAARALALTIIQRKDNPSYLLALEANQMNRENGGNPQDPDVFGAMRAAYEHLRPNNVLRGQQDSIRALAVTSAGREAIAAGHDGKLVKFDLSGENKPVPIATVSSPVQSLAVRSDGALIAVGTGAGKVELRDLRNPGAAPRELVVGSGIVSAVEFQPGGSLVAAANLDGGVKVWNADRPDNPIVLREAGPERVTALAFSRDGKSLAAALEKSQTGALVWTVAEPAAAPREICGTSDIRSVAFSPDGKTLACGGRRGEILSAKLTGGAPVSLPGHASSVNALAFSPRGDSLASASSDGTIRLWGANRLGAPPIVLRGHDSWVWAIGFTPDGRRLISAGEDRTVRIWAASTDVLAADLCSAPRRDPVLQQNLSEKEWREHMPADMPYREGRPCPGG